MTNGELFQGAIALITGANKGIGYEVARGLGAMKIVVLIGARDEAKGQAAAANLKGEGIDARFVPLDVTSRDGISRAARWIEDQFSHLDILVNNAGIANWGDKPSEADLARVREVYETNLFGPMAVTQAMLPLLRRSRRGRIVNVSSSLGSLAMANDSQSPISQFLSLGYNTSKTALNSMTVQFANELRGTAIKVNAVCPGYCATDINGHSGPRSAAQGAVAPVRYATLGDDGPSGGVFDEDGPVAW
jgi:NAD(P)-dependent dehydrogenase (short-subunit alcohol dehydrogenase family)